MNSFPKMDIYSYLWFIGLGLFNLLCRGSTVSAQGLPASVALEQLRVVKSLQTNNYVGDIRETIENAIPGVSYPVLREIPQTGFRCKQVAQPGYYADQSAHCQVYRRCDIDGTMTSFICPNKTLFNQVTLVCDWFYNVDCAKAVAFYSYSNPRMFINGNFLEDPMDAPSLNRLPLQPSRGRDFGHPDARVMTPFRQFQLEDSDSGASGDEAAPDTPLVAIAEHPNNDREPITHHQIQHAPSPQTRHDEPAMLEARQLQIPTEFPGNTALSMRTEKPRSDATPLPPGASLFFASERFASPLFSFPPQSEADDQEPTAQTTPHPEATATFIPTISTTATTTTKPTTPPPPNQPMQFLQLQSMRARPRQRLMDLAMEAWTLPSTQGTGPQSPKTQPNTTVPPRQRRVLRPNYAVTVGPSLFAV